MKKTKRQKKRNMMRTSAENYLGTVGAIIDVLATFGFEECLPAMPHEDECFRVEGEGVIVAVERAMGQENGMYSVAYDAAVYCRNIALREPIADAIAPLVKKFGLREMSVLNVPFRVA